MNTLPVGTARTEPWLRLDDTGHALRHRILDGLNARRNTLVESAFGRHPQPGDIVVEVTRALWSPDERIRTIGLGFFLAKDGGTSYIQYGPNTEDVSEWGNCALAVVPARLIERLLP